MGQQIPAGQTRPVPTIKGICQVIITPQPGESGHLIIYIPSGPNIGHQDIPYPTIPPPTFDFDGGTVCGYNEAPLSNGFIDVDIHP